MAISDLKAGGPVEEEFVVREKSLRELRSGQGQYLSLVLMDETGQTIEARAWDRAEGLAGECDSGDVVLVKGQAAEYRGQVQIKVTSLTRRPAEEARRFVPSLNEEQRSKLEGKLKAFIASVKDTYLRALLEQVLGDEKTWAGFCASTAARSIHSAYVGGLLEHTVNAATIAEAICTLYPQISRDLLMTAVMLHDIGKIDTYEQRGAVFEYSEAGRLIGEPVLGERRILAAINRIQGFPARHRMMMSHLLLSHHGEYEFGAPVLPSSLEAFALHLIDNLEAKITAVSGIMEREKDPEKVWSEFSRWLNRSIYLQRLEEES